jgi:hypothetical protein
LHQKLRNYPEPSQRKDVKKTKMRATNIEKPTAATSESIYELFHKARRSYEKALKSSLQLQEESVNLWKYLFTKLDSAGELQAKFESAEVFPKGCAVPVFPAIEIAMARKAAMEQEL